MRLYYEPETGRPLYTISSEMVAPPGDWIEVDDTLHPIDLTRHHVLEGALTAIEDLADSQAEAIETVNAQVGEVRKRFITVLPGQEMIYQAKESEARAYIELDPEPEDLLEFPLMAAEIGITAPTAWELAQVWLNMGAMWRATAATLENLRLTAIGAVENAGSAAEIDQAVATCLGALEVL